MQAQAKSLRFLGEGKKLQVPFFQRRYVWQEGNWKELLHTFLNNDTKPFLGSLIVKHISQSNDFIIDGQQRLTTITILAKAIYDSLFSDKKQSGIRREIESFLFYKDNSADDFEDSHVKIEHSRLDRKDYEAVIKAGLLDENKEIALDKIDETSSNIFQCYKYYREQLKDFTTDQLKNLFNALFNQDRLVFVLIELFHDDVNEQNIFDTINRAGVHLNAADIIKNNLFKRLIDLCRNEEDKNDVIKIYSQNWDVIFNNDLSTLSLSEVLNKRADLLNIVHDEKYRNYAGLRKQYYFRVLKAVSNGKKGSPSGVPRKIDYEVVNLYKTNRFIFDKLLEEFNRKYR